MKKPKPRLGNKNAQKGAAPRKGIFVRLDVDSVAILQREATARALSQADVIGLALRKL